MSLSGSGSPSFSKVVRSHACAAILAALSGVSAQAVTVPPPGHIVEPTAVSGVIQGNDQISGAIDSPNEIAMASFAQSFGYTNLQTIVRYADFCQSGGNVTANCPTSGPDSNEIEASLIELDNGGWSNDSITIIEDPAGGDTSDDDEFSGGYITFNYTGSGTFSPNSADTIYFVTFKLGGGGGGGGGGNGKGGGNNNSNDFVMALYEDDALNQLGVQNGESILVDSSLFAAGGTGAISHFTFFSATRDPRLVPLPAGAWLMLGGIGALVAIGRRRRAVA